MTLRKNGLSAWENIKQHSCPETAHSSRQAHGLSNGKGRTQRDGRTGANVSGSRVETVPQRDIQEHSPREGAAGKSTNVERTPKSEQRCYGQRGEASPGAATHPAESSAPGRAPSSHKPVGRRRMTEQKNQQKPSGGASRNRYPHGSTPRYATRGSFSPEGELNEGDRPTWTAAWLRTEPTAALSPGWWHRSRPLVGPTTPQGHAEAHSRARGAGRRPQTVQSSTVLSKRSRALPKAPRQQKRLPVVARDGGQRWDEKATTRTTGVTDPDPPPRQHTLRSFRNKTN